MDAVVNNGVFLCMKPGYYHISAALSAAVVEGGEIEVSIMHNARRSARAG